jgi:hypothetical protein
MPAAAELMSNFWFEDVLIEGACAIFVDNPRF